MNITIVGHVCIDENRAEKSSYKAAGSPAMFMWKVLKAFGNCKIKIISNRGYDFEEYEKDIKVFPEEANDSQTLVYENIDEDGKRTQYAHYRENSPPVIITEELKEIIYRTDILFIAPILHNYKVSYIRSILENANPDCLRILAPQGYFRQFDEDDRVHFREFAEAGKILPLFDYTILSDEDYPDILKRAGEWSDEFNTKIIVTRGENGANLYENGSQMHIDTEPIEDIVDSTGSGDIFTATFAYKFYKTQETRKSIDFANKVAGRCLRYNSSSILSSLLTLKRS